MSAEPHQMAHSKDDGEDRGSKDVISDVDTAEQMCAVTAETSCGYWSWRPSGLQCCNTPKWLLVNMCYYAVFESMCQYGLVSASLATWERRYALSSTQSAWIVTSEDVAAGIVSLCVGYLAGFWHKGTLVAFGAGCMSLAFFVFLLPQIFSDVYTLGSAPVEECRLNGSDGVCEQGADTAGSSSWVYGLIVAQLIFGIGSPLCYSVGIPYMDDNIPHVDLPLYIGIMNAVSTGGAMVGFVVAAFALDVYVDVLKVDMEDIRISSGDPRWVGAWWIPFAACFVLSLPCVCILAGYPRSLPAAAALQESKRSQAHAVSVSVRPGKKEANNEPRKQSVSDLLRSLKIIFTNPVFVLVTLGAVVESGGVSAATAFLPKILQFQFGQKASVSILVTGVALVPGAAVGQLAGGLIAKCLRLRLRGQLWEIIILQLLSVITVFCFLLHCDMKDIAGVTAPYTNQSELALDSACNAACNCTTYSYDPICGSDDREYFSPCHAACTQSTNQDGGELFYNCSCVSGSLQTAGSGECGSTCWQFYLFVPIFFLLTAFTMAEGALGFAATTRCVPEELRTFALGLQSPIVRFLGNIPIPLLLGAIFDYACVTWQDNCGDRGSCWIYSSGDLSRYLCITFVAIKVIAVICNSLAIWLYKPPPGCEDESPSKASTQELNGNLGSQQNETEVDEGHQVGISGGNSDTSTETRPHPGGEPRTLSTYL